MAAKDIRNTIIGLIILIVAVQFLFSMAGGYIGEVPDVPIDLPNLSSVQGIVDAFVIFFVILIIILIPVYLSKRSSEKETQTNL